MKKFIYMVQGKAELVSKFDFLKSDKSDLLTLTYDKQLENSIFFPGSTWAEGRNKLLEEALKRGKYEYYIFLDDDVGFVKGSPELFEDELDRLRPACAMPVFFTAKALSLLGIGYSFTSGIFFSPFSFQVCKLGDAQMIAFHRDIVEEEIVLPYITEFDNLSWWFASSAQQLLLYNIYKNHVLQFHKVVIKNLNHSNYPKIDFQKEQKQWFNNNFNLEIFDYRLYSRNYFQLKYLIDDIIIKKRYRGKLIWKLITEPVKTLVDTIRYKPKSSYKLSDKKLSEIIKEGSVLQKNGF